MVKDAKIEVVRIYRSENGGAIKAFCDIQFDNDYVVKGFKVVEGNGGLFVGMPSQMGKNGKWFSIFQVLSDDAKNRIQETVLAAYKE